MFGKDTQGGITNLTKTSQFNQAKDNTNHIIGIELDEKIKLDMEKRDLELTLENEFKKQEEITRYYDDIKKKLQNEIWNMEQKSNEVERVRDQKESIAKELEKKLAKSSTENRNFYNENNSRKEELKR